jgi:hypothetical protein
VLPRTPTPPARRHTAVVTHDHGSSHDRRKDGSVVPNILVLASETIGGEKLLETVKRRAAEGDARFFVCVPQTRPRHGNVIYNDAVRDAAQVRVDLTRAFLRAEGLEEGGAVGDPDPFAAAMDAIDEWNIDEIILSTRPAPTSGWMRRDLPERLAQASGLPVEHVVVDIDREGLPFDVTLVVANQTVAGPELVQRLKAKAAESPRRFIVAVPQDSGDGTAAREARGRLKLLLSSLDESDIVAAGFIADPDPFTAIMNSLQVFYITEVLISTLPENKSRWLAKGLLDRVKRASGRPVEHVESSADSIPAPSGAGAPGQA